MKRYLVYILATLFPLTLFSQEYLTGVGNNSVIKQYRRSIEEKPGAYFKSEFIEYNPLELPFYDDFSKKGVYPDSNKWLDDYVYVNPDYGVFPINMGVATFDVLDEFGDIYGNANFFPFAADYLTSFPIRLDSIYDDGIQGMRKLTPADSVYFSFYYQPQGRGVPPLPHDSLILEFGRYTEDTVFSYIESFWLHVYEIQKPDGEYYGEGDTLFPGDIIELDCDIPFYTVEDILIYTDSVLVPCDSIYTLATDWKEVWSAGGDSLETFTEKYNTYFRYVTIPIKDTSWFKGDFQFRFRNYGSISNINSWKSNTDQWNIDMVYLNANRKYNDYYQKKLCFNERPRSLLLNYSSMPYYQYSDDLFSFVKTIDVYANNLDSVQHFSTFEFLVTDKEGEIIESYTTSYDGYMEPLFNMSSNSYQPFVNFMSGCCLFDLDAHDTACFNATYIIHDQNNQFGDTVTAKQNFYNYLSYDDGTAEAGYGLSPAGAMLAYQFNLQKPDTLRGVRMFFNKVVHNYNEKLFHITVWNDNNGEPGLIIYQKKNVLPDFTDGFNNFADKYFTDKELILGQGKFYIGWVQTTNDNLNIGFDRNTNSKDKIFYNVDGKWTNSNFEGSLMIRPLLGAQLVPMDENAGYKNSTEKLLIYPNPPEPDGMINIVIPNVQSSKPEMWKYLKVSIYNIYGQLIYSVPYSGSSVTVSELKQGIYIVDVFDSAYTRHYTSKLIITQ
jgi:hypothetical protein